jgi:hypothetical protein
VVEVRRYFPPITDNALAWDCVQRIVGWQPPPEPPQGQK